MKEGPGGESERSWARTMPDKPAARQAIKPLRACAKFRADAQAAAAARAMRGAQYRAALGDELESDDAGEDQPDARES